MESLNSNEVLSTERTCTNMSVDGSLSPVLSTNKFNRRIIINRKLNKQRSKAKLDNGFTQNVELDLNAMDSNSFENRIKTIEKLKNERMKYYDLLCSTNLNCPVEYANEQNCNKSPLLLLNQKIQDNIRNNHNYSMNQNEVCTIQTASGKKIEIPQNIINEYKYVFDDIFNDQISDSVILKYPIKSKMKASKIPVLSNNRKVKVNGVSNKNAIFSNCNSIKTDSQLESLKKVASNNLFCTSVKENEVICKVSLSEDIAAESFIDAARDIIEEKKLENEFFDSEITESKFSSSNTMNKLYSNQKFEECSSSTNSLESLTFKESFGLFGTTSEITMESSEINSSIIKSCPSSNLKNINHKSAVTLNGFEELSVTDIACDDWSDTLYVVSTNDFKKGLVSEAKIISVNKNSTSSKGNENKNTPTMVKFKDFDQSAKQESCLNITKINIDFDNFVQNSTINESNFKELQETAVQHTEVPKIKTVCKDNMPKIITEHIAEEKLNNKPISNSKSVIHVNIPLSDNDSQNNSLNVKNIIELHRNKNFAGNSEDSVSNMNYKLSQHSIQVRKRALKTQRKLINSDFVGFDKNVQETAHQNAVMLINNVKKVEKEINDAETLIHTKAKVEKKSRDKRSKKQKWDNLNEKDKDDDICMKECKLKHDRKKKEKVKHGKLNAVTEEISENTHEKINRTVTYDHISIISEQSCRKYKDHKKRKSIDKEVVHQSNNNNKIIELSPNQKKFKIEIDCNNKLRINICCNGMQNTCDKQLSKCDKEITKCNKEKIDLKAVANNSVSSKDKGFSKKTLKGTKDKFHVTNYSLNKHDDNTSVQQCLELQNDKLECDQKCTNNGPNLNETSKDTIIKKFSNKTPKLYCDVKKTYDSACSDKKLETHDEFNSNLKSMHHSHNHTLQDFSVNSSCGFKSASGKNFKISKDALKNAQKMYHDTEVISNNNTEKVNCNTNSLDQKVNNTEVIKIEQCKQRTRILYADINNTYPNSKVVVPNGYQLISGKLMKNESIKDDERMHLQFNRIQNQEDTPEECNLNKDKFPCGFQSAAGKDIKISWDSIKKAKSLFEDNDLPAGDSINQTTLFSGFESASSKEIDISEKHLVETKKFYEEVDNSKLCMGDFKENLSNVIQEAKYCGNKKSEYVNSSTSRKAFELLEDVVETVDCALQKIQKNRVRSTNARRRLGISKCKQINVSKEKIEKAKRLFSNESFDDSIRDLSSLVTPSKSAQIGCHSTPVRNNLLLTNFYKSTIESEITPIKNNECRKDEHAACNMPGDSLIVIREKTPGSLDDWYATVSKQINSLKEVLKNLEGKKCNLEKQMGVFHYADKEHKRRRPGILYNNKTANNQRVPLKVLKDQNSGDIEIEGSILNVTAKNANMVHFNYTSSENIEATQDGAIVIPNDQNLVGLSEIEIAFKTMTGIEPSLIPKGWIANHFRLIVWKLASYGRFSPQQLSGILSVENIIQQLKYRYDREIDRAERPAIRKILEKDDIPQKRMVLCVSDIIEVGNSKVELELTDGWYCIRTIIDDPLIHEVKKKKIGIGTKLIINGAQLLNCDGCHPLEVTDLVKLKITFNCTRRAAWYVKLGYQRCPEPFVIPLSSVHSDGGMISCIKVYILRVYPIRYMEQINDKKVWRNSKAEEKYANNFENERLEKIEKIQYSVQQTFEQELRLDMRNKFMERSKLNKTEILKITCPKTLYGLLESSNDPESLLEVLLPSQRVSVLEYRQHMCFQHEQEISRRISEEIEKLKLTNRKVTPILKLLVLDDYSKSEKPQQFCIWNPKEDDILALKEGVSITVYNVVPRSNGDLFSNSKTYFKANKQYPSHPKFKRQLFPISMTLDICSKPFLNEFDTVGLVVQININTNNQNLWIADSTGRLLFIKTKDGPETCRLLDGVVKGEIISLLNLIYCNPQKEFGQAFANQFTVIANSQINYLQENVELFKVQLPKDLSNLLSECEQNIEKYKLKVDMKQNSLITSFMQQSLIKSTISGLDISDDSTLIPSKLTATDIAMSLIDTDKFT